MEFFTALTNIPFRLSTVLTAMWHILNFDSGELLQYKAICPFALLLRDQERMNEQFDSD